MLGSDLLVGGVPVVPSEAAVNIVGRWHVCKRWMNHGKRCYASRVSKKWAKRFGEPKREPSILYAEMPGFGRVIFAHPTIIAKLKAQATTRQYNPVTWPSGCSGIPSVAVLNLT